MNKITKKTTKSKIRALFVLMSMAILLLLPSVSFAEETLQTGFKGMWVATVYGIDFPSKTTTSPEVLMANIDEVLDTAQKAGMTAIFVQVRPTGDAFYKSDIFPWSKFLTGTEGLAPEDGFDPMVYWIDEAHKRGIEFHAWLNPYRITRDLKVDNDAPYSVLAANNPAVLHKELTVRYSDGNLYYNPGLPEVEDLIVSGVQEIIDNYDVDGIHFDDYFYPGASFGDASAFKTYGYFGETLDDFRRRSVTHMIKTVHETVASKDNDIAFGVSPFGIWANNTSLSEGSATRGNESYFSHYADTKYWVEHELVDYIAPQLYWYIGYELADYEVLVDWWSDVVSGRNVDLYIGQGAYRLQTTDESAPWYGVTELKNQLLMNMSYSEIKGSLYYNYSAFRRSDELVDLIASQKTNVNTFISIKEEAAASNLLPQTTQVFSMYANAENISLGCYAPAGSIVNIKIGGGYYFLKADPYNVSGDKIFYECQVPTDVIKNILPFKPLYTIRYKGETYQYEADGEYY